MDDPPDTSWASHITPEALENLLERYSSIDENLKSPIDDIVDLDVSFRICLQRLIATQQRLRRKSLSMQDVENLLDNVEYELVLAQDIALWKRDVLVSVNKELYDLAGREHKPAVEKASSAKTKVRPKKSCKENAKESVRRSEREKRSPCVIKAGDKESPASSNTTTPQPTSAYRTKRRGREGDSEGSSKKRTSGRLARPVRSKKHHHPIVLPAPTSLPTTADEPTYCLCEQISFGEMIGCDNEKCIVEWFHFECVQLKVKPKGKWYCPLCRGDRLNILKASLAR